MNTNKLFEQLIEGQHLTAEAMQAIMKACMQGELQDGQIAAFLALMRMKGETVEELTTAAQVMMDFAHCIDLGEGLIDIVGTGGDGKNTFNVSTLSSIVAAASGAKVAKHGNRSVSSSSGSSDLLMQAGFKLTLTDEELKTCMQKQGVCFLFAPYFHKALQNVRNARQQLGIRSFFNLLGPLVNPARVKRQVVGVYAERLLRPIAEVLANLGSERALVIHARDGLDELSINAVSDVVEYANGEFKHWTLDPADYGLYHPSLQGILVNSPAESLQLIEQVLAGKKGPARDITLLNTAAALYCTDLAAGIHEGISLAAKAIDSGIAKAHFYQLRDLTQQSGLNT
ncbi:anthranilate phosphoribosyltransferase [Legionella sp. MW5194]|uniref:anthranilate phosphoribosyltransferase n=1 Tax=Legionella sp. MW5194 TaxID=2662448 RepID=UPI00193DE6AF|nr:anthranilate phosphoribosyltransferase [Legionella sp. MW5194]QRN04237.1 anthranilate phosphoribosyltransferase [Legionella sp. MW5194]